MWRELREGFASLYIVLIFQTLFLSVFRRHWRLAPECLVIEPLDHLRLLQLQIVRALQHVDWIDLDVSCQRMGLLEEVSQFTWQGLISRTSQAISGLLLLLDNDVLMNEGVRDRFTSACSVKSPQEQVQLSFVPLCP